MKLLMQVLLACVIENT